ncbi:MAG TPA: hypothetical protein PKC69_14275 [Chitinophagaceae bacterium]|nr:hypothetical protein [Chitinophagaceae bacterium]
MKPGDVAQTLPAEWGIVPSGGEDALAVLEHTISRLIAGDMNKLISLLYRLDVSEEKLKQTLQSHPQEDAARLITALVVERQWQRIKSREQFSGKRQEDADW